MKRTFNLLLLILMVHCTIQAQRIIENPIYDFRTHGVRKIIKIELTPDSTILHMRCTYPPNYWISVGRDITIKTSNNGETYPIISVKGTEFDKQSFTPECGYQDFILTFDPIKEEIKEIDIVSKNWSILGLKLTEQAEDKKSRFPELIRGSWSDITGEKGWTYGFYPSYAIIGHQFWTYSKIKKTRKGYQLSLQCDDKTKELYVTHKDTLLAIGESKKEQQLYTLGTEISKPSEPVDLKIDPLQSGEMVLQGFIDGYHPKADFKTDYVNVEDVLNDIDIEFLFEIQPDGRFSVNLNLPHAGQFYFTINEHYFDFIGVPNDTLTIYINWEGVIESDCDPNNSYYDSGHSRYMGKYGRLNMELKALSLFTSYNWRKFQKTRKLDFQAFYKEAMKDFKQDSTQLEQQLEKNNILPLTKELSRLELICNYVDGALFEYTMYSDELEWKSYIGQGYKKFYYDCSVIPENFFSLLKYIDASDPRIIIAADGFTRYSHASFFGNYMGGIYETADVIDYISQQEKLSLAEQEVLSQLKQNKTNPIQFDSIQQKQIFAKGYKIIAKHPTLSSDYHHQMYLYGIKKGYIEVDSILKTFCSKPHNIIQEIVIYHNWLYELGIGQIGRGNEIAKNMSPELKQKITTLTKEYITTPFLRESIDKVFHQELNAKKTNELAEGAGKELFQKIIAPHKGKYILVDFWATWCGPCVGGIEKSHDLRTSLKDKNIAFMFITGPSSPIGSYNKIIKDLVGDKHRLNKDDYKVLESLFNIKSIPRYILVDTQGKVIDDDFTLSNLESKLKELGVIEK